MANRKIMVALVTGALALVVSISLVVFAYSFKESPRGVGENIEWLRSYLLLLGLPVSLIVVLLIPAVAVTIAAPWLNAAMVAAVTINWMVLGYVAAWIWIVVKSRLDAFGRETSNN